MSLIMGIDTGGTYTDGVIVEYENKKILHKAKSLTTKGDLTIGIENCLQKLHFKDYKEISLVSLSTTLATNAIVEGKGCKTGVILIGDEPKDKLPTNQVEFLEGKFDIKGRVVKNLEEEKVVEAIERFRGKVEAVAISGYASVRNPEHELYVKRKVREILDIPVACAHELTSTLGFYERTVTSILNASLIPIIERLICATKTVLEKKDIKVPIMVVKGDGSLMHESMAMEKPIDTILSGPASSIIGGTFLTGEEDAIIMDMGGTTTDIANLEEGVVRTDKEGAKVGGWLTRVKAAEISTFGIGGDSYLHFNVESRLVIGPRKVWPLCVFGEKYPYLADELELYRKKDEYLLWNAQETDCFILTKKPGMPDLSQLDLEILKLLEKGPHSVFYLADQLEKDADSLGLENLEDLGVVERISLTPTDLLHVEGKYTKWDKRIAEMGVKLFAERLNQSIPEFLKMARQLVTNKLCTACLQSLADFENQSCDITDNKGAAYLIHKALNKEDGKSKLFSAAYTLKKPIVALGAPVSAWMEMVAEKLNTQLIIPEHSEVANAVGAAVGQVIETVEVLIRPDLDTKQYIVHAPWSRESFNTLEDAVEYATSGAESYAVSAVNSAIQNSYQVNVKSVREDIYADQFISKTEKTYVETRITAIVTGKLDLKGSHLMQNS